MAGWLGRDVAGAGPRFPGQGQRAGLKGTNFPSEHQCNPVQVTIMVLVTAHDINKEKLRQWIGRFRWRLPHDIMTFFCGSIH